MFMGERGKRGIIWKKEPLKLGEERIFQEIEQGLVRN